MRHLNTVQGVLSDHTNGWVWMQSCGITRGRKLPLVFGPLTTGRRSYMQHAEVSHGLQEVSRITGFAQGSHFTTTGVAHGLHVGTRLTVAIFSPQGPLFISMLVANCFEFKLFVAMVTTCDEQGDNLKVSQLAALMLNAQDNRAKEAIIFFMRILLFCIFKNSC